MDILEKVEKLVEKTGVSYEDAKSALEKSEGDILDAMIVLEKEGKVQAPRNSTYSTQYDDQQQYVSVSMQVENARQEDDARASAKIKRGLRKIWHFLKTNYLIQKNKKGETVMTLPLWAAALILLMFSWITVIFVIGSLFLGYRYEFSGETNLKVANDVMDKASTVAEKVKEEYNKL